MLSQQIKKTFFSILIVASFGAYAVWNRSYNSVPAISPSQTKNENGESFISPKNGSGITANAPAKIIPNQVIGSIRQYFEDFGDDEEEHGQIIRTRNANGGNTPVPQPQGTAKTPSSPSVAPTQNGIYKDGTYTGNTAYAYTGNIQVAAIINSGKITDIRVMDGSQSGTSKQINADALPVLRTETIQSQNANINAVSGATYTSAAYIESLTSALNQAKNI